MIIYIAPQDKRMYQRTLEFAKKNEIRMVVMGEDGFLKLDDANAGRKIHYLNGDYLFGDRETIWIVGHGNEREIGDEKGGVTINAEDLAGILKSIFLIHGNKYRGSIVIDTCRSGVKGGDRKTFADNVYGGLKGDFPHVTVGGWIGDAVGPISGGRTELLGQEFSKDDGFAWANRIRPEVGDHDVLAKLA